MKIERRWGFVKDLLLLLLGSCVYACGFRMFVEPYGIIMGGATGLGTVFGVFFGLPIGLIVLLVNLPLLLFSVIRWGKRSVLRTLPGIFLSSLMIDVMSFVPAIATDRLIAAVFGGAVTGLGIGMMLWRGYTTGGSDLAGSLLHDALPRISLSVWVFVLDIAVIIAGAVVLAEFELLFYSAVVSLVFSFVLDRVLCGFGRAKLAFIMSGKPQEVASLIAGELSRGVTQLYGRGYYSDKGQLVLLCAIKRTELFHLKQCVCRVDPSAFVIIGNAEEIMGLGFGEHSEK